MRNNSFKFLSKHGTYHYLKALSRNGERVVVSRYGDGEYFIMLGMKGKNSARQEVTEKLTKLLNNSFKKSGQLVCLPNKSKISKENLHEDDNILKNKIGRYIIQNSNHSLYGQVQWRDVDLLRYNSDLITDFFIGRTLVITGHKEVCEIAFRSRIGVMVDVYGVPKKNASVSYINIRNDLFSISNKYKNMIFSCGAISKVLISDLIDKCRCNLIDLGSGIGVIINPYSTSYQVVRSWPGVLRRKDLKIVKEYSDNFFKTLSDKILGD